MANFNFNRMIETYFNSDEIAKIRQCRIGIAGVGGLGSNCAINLVRCGFINFTIVDYDVVEASNLNRQYYSPRHIGRSKVECLAEILYEINPECRIEKLKLHLDDSNVDECFANSDVVVEAFDNAESKIMIARHFASSSKLFVCASGLAGYGNSDRILTRKIRDNFFVIGDEVSQVTNSRKPLAPCVTIAAAKQADVILSWILQKA